MLPIAIFERLYNAWKIYDFDLRTLLDNYRVNSVDLPRLIDYLTERDLHTQGVFLHDQSGLASHLLGLRLIELWQNDSSFKAFDQILWLPFAKLLELPVQPSSDRYDSLNRLGTLINPNYKWNDSKTIVIVTGIDCLSHQDFCKADFQACAETWMQHIHSLPRIAIGNYVPPYLTQYFPNSTSITLPQVYLNLRYTVRDSYEDVRCVTFPGGMLVDEVTEHTRRRFRFNTEKPEGVFSITSSTVKNYIAGQIDIVPEIEEHVDPMQSLLTIQDVIRILAGDDTTDVSEKPIAVIDTPAKWYYAALTAAKVHASNPSKKGFFLYLIAGHLIVRRMTPDSMHYIIDLGPIQDYAIQSVSSKHEFVNEDIKFILEQIIKCNDFSELDAKKFPSLLKKAKGDWERQATAKRNNKLKEEAHEIPKLPIFLSGESKKLFKQLEELFNKISNNDVNNIEIGEGIKTLPKELQGASYQTIQKNVNRHFPQGITSLEACRQIVNVMNNEPIDDKFSEFILMVATSLLAEPARNSRVFFSLYAMLSLVLTNKFGWTQFIGLPERASIDITPTTDWQTLIVADGMDALGGIHPMMYKGSFWQSNPAYNQHHTPGITHYGVTWPELKTQLLYATWLGDLLAFSGMGIILGFANVSFEINEDSRLLTRKDQPFIMRDLELYLRIDGSYDHGTDAANILVEDQRPFARAMHLIGDPQHIKIITCGDNGKYGYFLRVPKQVGETSEDHFIHLTAYQAFMIAIKFDAMGDNHHALQLYNYLCHRHPKAIPFCYSRLQCLVLHNDLMTNKVLRQREQEDLDFLKDRDLQLGDAVQLQIKYFQAIHGLRTTIQDPRIDSLSVNVVVDLLGSSIESTEETLNSYSHQHDEEAFVLQSWLAIANQKLFHRLLKERELLQKNPDLMGLAVVVQKECFKYLTAYSLSWHRTTPNFKDISAVFKYMIDSNDLSLSVMAAALSPTYIQKSEFQQHTSLPADKIPLEVNLFEKLLLSWLNKFKKFMVRQKNNIKKEKKQFLREIREKPNIFKSASGFDAVQDDNITIKRISENGKYALLLKPNWQISVSMIDAWGSMHDVEVSNDVDADLGPCVKLTLNTMQNSRSSYQPTPHPNSFLILQYATTRPTANDTYFLAIKRSFETCIEEIKEWDLKSETVDKFSYHIYGNETQLPQVHLIREGNEHHVLIELPNGTPIQIIFNWLAQYDFAFHWVNDQERGRCLYLPQINIRKRHSNYNIATSSGDAIFPFLNENTAPRKIESKTVKPIPPKQLPNKVSPLTVNSYINSHTDVELIQQKYVSRVYWYEDSDMNNILNGYLDQYQRKTSDNRPVEIIAPLDNLSRYTLQQVLIDRDRREGVILIPFNLGCLHWVGLIFECNSAGKLVRADFYDSLGNEVPQYLNNILHLATHEGDPVRIFNKIQQNLIRQNNGSDCGPCTIQNLLAGIGFPEANSRSSAERRLQNLNLLEAVDNRFYNIFYRRQMLNQSSFTTLKNSHQFNSTEHLDANTPISIEEYLFLLELARDILSLNDYRWLTIADALKLNDIETSSEHAERLTRLRTTLFVDTGESLMPSIRARIFCMDSETMNLHEAPLRIDYDNLSRLHTLLVSCDLEALNDDLKQIKSNPYQLKQKHILAKDSPIHSSVNHSSEISTTDTDNKRPSKVHGS